MSLRPTPRPAAAANGAGAGGGAGADRLTLVLRAGYAARQQEEPCDGRLGDAVQKLVNPNQAKRAKLSAEIADIERRMNAYDDEWEKEIQKLEEWNNRIQLRAQQMQTIKANELLAMEAGVEPDPGDAQIFKEIERLYREATDGFNKTHAEADRLVKAGDALEQERDAKREELHGMTKQSKDKYTMLTNVVEQAKASGSTTKRVVHTDFL